MTKVIEELTLTDFAEELICDLPEVTENEVDRTTDGDIIKVRLNFDGEKPWFNTKVTYADTAETVHDRLMWQVEDYLEAMETSARNWESPYDTQGKAYDSLTC